ncbi:MAG: ribosome biogenesis GTP-binding protein YihA/YsxC [Bacteroidales bacterium]|nr:ribosome biogenesis GTP-binding protein YihA/YsxC [Bacteroidales bacterium]
MVIKTAEYIKSSVHINDCPKPYYPEYAFIGRSNVGKSSLINMLLNRKNLSKVSSKPGKTRTINHFLVNGSWYLVDLPGFGFAKVSQEVRKQWDSMILEYLLHRKTLSCVFMLLDSRIPLQIKDMQFMQWLGQNQVPFVAISTKIDQCSQQQIEIHKKQLYSFFDTYWETRPQHVLSSSKEKKGRDEVLQIIEQANQVFRLSNVK